MHRGSIDVLGKQTGKTLRKKSRDEDNARATPIVVEHSGKTQVITAASDLVRSLDLDNGEIIWQCSGLTGNVVSCPVADGDHVICMSGYKGYSAIAIPLNLTGEISGGTSFRWSVDRGTPYVPSPVLGDGLLYFNQSNQAIVRCMDSSSGETPFEPQRLGNIANVYASPVAAAGRVYFVGRNGKPLILNTLARIRAPGQRTNSMNCLTPLRQSPESSCSCVEQSFCTASKKPNKRQLACVAMHRRPRIFRASCPNSEFVGTMRCGISSSVGSVTPGPDFDEHLDVPNGLAQARQRAPAILDSAFMDCTICDSHFSSRTHPPCPTNTGTNIFHINAA